MTCHPFIDADVADRAPCSALGHHLDSTAQLSGPAATIETQPTTGTCERIASRCKRLRFRSNEERKRYLAKHRDLASKTCSGAADA